MTAANAEPPTWLAGHLVAPGSATDVGAEVQLAGSWCAACSRSEFPARMTCPRCGGEMARRPLSLEGAVVGHTAVLHQPPGAVLEAPYGVVAVRHEDGVTVLGTLVGGDLERIAIGDRARSVVIAVGDELGFGYRRV